MSEITSTSTQTQDLALDSPRNSEAELAAAFETKGEQSQVVESTEQVGNDGGASSPSSPDSGTPQSSTASTPSREELLANLTWDEVQSLEHLRPALTSAVQSEAAKQNRGKTREIEDRIRQETILQTWKPFFDNMDKAELSDLIQRDENARRLYALTSTGTPPPPNPSTPDTPQQPEFSENDADRVVGYFTNIIQTNSARVARLPDADKARLDPSTFLRAHPDKTSEQVVALWQDEIVTAEVNAKLAAAQAQRTQEDQESAKIDADAAAEAARIGGVLLEGGRSPAGVLPDYGTRSDLLLEDAFTRTALKAK